MIQKDQRATNATLPISKIADPHLEKNENQILYQLKKKVLYRSSLNLNVDEAFKIKNFLNAAYFNKKK